jgi:hypothetical protein
MTERDIWESDFREASARIRPWIAFGLDPNGEEFTYVTENAPGPLAAIYHQLKLAGEAAGWLNPAKEGAR